MREKTLKKRVVTPAMLLVTIGVVYGDIGTSPMYVLKSIIENNGGLQTGERALIIGAVFSNPDYHREVCGCCHEGG